MNKNQTKRLEKVKDDIEYMFAGQLWRYHVTPYEVRRIVDVYNKLTQGSPAETMFHGVKDYFIRRKFTVTEKETGWQISL